MDPVEYEPPLEGADIEEEPQDLNQEVMDDFENITEVKKSRNFEDIMETVSMGPGEFDEDDSSVAESKNYVPAPAPPNDMMALLQCKVCQEIPKKNESMVTTCCMYSWCKPCSQKHLESNATCPQCQKELTEANIILNMMAEQMKPALMSFSIAPPSAPQEEEDGKEEPDLCPTHKEVVTIFCEECATIVCNECITSDEHQGHKFSKLSKKFDQYSETVKVVTKGMNKLKRSLDRLKPTYTDLHKESMDNYKNVLDKFTVLVNDYLSSHSIEMAKTYEDCKKSIKKNFDKHRKLVGKCIEDNPVHNRPRDVTNWGVSKKALEELEDIRVDYKRIEKLKLANEKEFLYPIYNQTYTFVLHEEHLDWIQKKQTVSEELTEGEKRPFLSFVYSASEKSYDLNLDISQFPFTEALFCLSVWNEELQLKFFQVHRVDKKTNPNFLAISAFTQKGLQKRLRENSELEIEVSLQVSEKKEGKEVLEEITQHLIDSLSDED